VVESHDQTLSEIGLPRANSNGLFLFSVIVIIVFGVMAYSCSSKKQGDRINLDSPPQPLTGNEWFIGQAKGIEPPKVTEPEIPAEIKTAAAKAPPKPPEKRLGGKVFVTPSASSTNEKSKSIPEDDIASLSPTRRNVSGRTTRPEYYLERDVEFPISDYEIKAGTALPAQLDISVNSDLGGPTVAHITRTIYDTVTGQHSLIPSGTKIYGNINPNISFGQTRVDVVWERIIFPNGASLVVQNMRASDRAGQTGLHHTVDHHFDRLFGGAILLSAISAGVQLSQPQQNSYYGSAPTVGQTVVGSVGQNIGQVSTEFIRRQMDVRPTIIIPSGEHFTVIVNKDMVLPGPYGEWE
jgi:type IV secretory pathway VirB10-like protein